MPRQETRKALRGGAVPYLIPEKLRYTGPESMKENMSLYGINAHGETTPDKKIIVVPPQTYIVFTAHSGEPAIGSDPAAKLYYGYGRDETREQYYTRLYNQLFSTEPRTRLAGFNKDLYIYEPGDILPDYNLYFYNMAKFITMHGIYKLPIEAVSGPTATRPTLYYGSTKYIIRRLLDSGQIKESDLDDIDPKDKEEILTKSLDVLKGEIFFMDPSKIKKSKVMKQIEDSCCRKNPDNLLYAPPFSKRLLKTQNNMLRLSYVLKLLPSEEGKTRRLFVMHFCRVPFDEFIMDYKPLYRTMSFAGKCKSLNDRGAGFNMIRLGLEFCKLPYELKSEFLKIEEGRMFITTLIKSIPSQLIPWSRCVPREYITTEYLGYIEMDDIININILFIIISKLISSFKRTIQYLKSLKTKLKIRNNLEKNVIAKLGEKHRNESEAIEILEERINKLTPIYEPIKNFYMKYSNYTKESFQESKERSELITKVYEEIVKKLRSIGFDNDMAAADPLYFKTTTLWVLKSFYERLLENNYENDFADIKRKLQEMDEYSEDDIVEKLNDKFSAYVGTTPETKEMIFLNFSPTNENENENEAVPVENVETLNLGGGRRKTRKRRLISKK
jgi:hypothetical protein